jgi:ABC-2 type transport system permease protein/capsular polysaccharide transport system permease protein
MLREGWFGSRARAMYDFGYIIPFNMVLTAVAMLQVRRVARHVVPE